MSLSTLIATAEGPDVTPGTVPAWALVFFEEESGKPLATMGSETYPGSVSAALPADLTGGSYEVVFEGMTDADYQRIHVDGRRHLAASLYLWWKDSPTGVAGDLARFTGLDHPLGAITPDPPALSLVAVIRVDRLGGRPGGRAGPPPGPPPLRGGGQRARAGDGAAVRHRRPARAAAGSPGHGAGDR